MAERVKRFWESDLYSGLPSRDLASCDYFAYIPDRLEERGLRMGSDLVRAISIAQSSLDRLDRKSSTLDNLDAIARLLLRAESVASSHIEGLAVGPRRLLRAEAARQMGTQTQDVTAEEVLGNIDAMRWAVDIAVPGRDIHVEDICEVHRRLVAGTRLAEIGGVARETQNWIGGSRYNPCSAEFIPPPPEKVADLLDDLCNFSNRDDLPALAQAAIAHAQFETIHPFADGNGRAGRALIHMILRRRGSVRKMLLPVSLVLATWTDEYIDALTRFRYEGDPDSDDAVEGTNRWIALFARASERAVLDAEEFGTVIDEMQKEWRRAAGNPRADSAASRLINVLPGAPVITVKTGALLAERSGAAVRLAVARLVDAGVLSSVEIGRREEAFEAPAVIDAFLDLERRLASPMGDTITSEPNRTVPARRQ